MKNFSDDCILLVLANRKFDPDERIDDLSGFLN
jgi:hypothetical protein